MKWSHFPQFKPIQAAAALRSESPPQRGGIAKKRENIGKEGELRREGVVALQPGSEFEGFSSIRSTLLSRFFAMTHPSTSSLALLLLLIGFAAAGPESDLRLRTMRSSACQEHMNLHTRLDVAEKKLEDTVEKLEVELVALLDDIESPKWRPLLDNSGKATVDILDDPGERVQPS
ncbi:hypothetical protein LDENG_00095110 [Lucifuga dentata]|nr:hypothetical protein LDENG_00095110 [Lucifuga dentata]